MQQEQLAEDRSPQKDHRLWELELIVSGAVIVALFQVPAVLDRVYFGLETHLSTDLIMLPYLVYYACKLALYGLIGTFLLIFFLRSFWVGLRGLDNALPGGIKWDTLHFPLQREAYQSRDLSLASLAHRVDTLCSSLFSVFFANMIVVGLSSVVFCVPSVLIAFPLMWITGIGYMQAFWWVIAAVFVLWLVPALFYAGIEKKVDRDPGFAVRRPRTVGLARWILRQFQRSPHTIALPIVYTFRSNLPKWVVQVVPMVIMIVLVSVFLISFLVQNDAIGFDSYVFFPRRPAQLGMDANHYADQVEKLSDTTPQIQSAIIDDAYVTLFIPYRVRRLNQWVAERCGLEPFRSERLMFKRSAEAEPEDRVARALNCLAGLYQVKLDGNVMETEYLFYQDPKSGMRGLQTMLDVRELENGHHILEVQVPRHADEKKEDHLRNYVIHFWR